jgi:hypothetical protein
MQSLIISYFDRLALSHIVKAHISNKYLWDDWEKVEKVLNVDDLVMLEIKEVFGKLVDVSKIICVR